MRQKDISEVLEDLDLGAAATFDSGHHSGSIQVRRINGGFQVVGITETAIMDKPEDVQVEVGRRRRIRDAQS